MSVFAPDVVSFDFGPPLQHCGGDEFRKRWTTCYRETEGVWRIVHEQVSVPVEVKSGTAMLDLQP
jgi:ketosteroid isomerase-like protein